MFTRHERFHVVFLESTHACNESCTVLVCENQVLLRRRTGLGPLDISRDPYQKEEPLVELQTVATLSTQLPTTNKLAYFDPCLHNFPSDPASFLLYADIYSDDFPLEAEEQWHPLESLQNLLAKHGHLRQHLLNQ